MMATRHKSLTADNFAYEVTMPRHSFPTPLENRITLFVRDLVVPFIPDNARLQNFFALPRLRTWRKAHNELHPVFSNAFALYDFLAERYLNGQTFDYLEFGVYKGQSLKYWVEHTSNPFTRFFGFDTFTGMPDVWVKLDIVLDMRTFDVQGKPPAISDPRVHVIKGLFQETVGPFLAEFTPQQQLVLNLDADLYPSELFVLTKCDAILTPGTIIVFDDFFCVMHDFRALDDYCSAYKRTYEVLAATPGPKQVAIRMTN
jgi:O-methyltransferase